MEVISQLHAPAALAPRKNTGTHSVGSCVGSGAGLEVLEKRRIPRPCQDSNPLPSSP